MEVAVCGRQRIMSYSIISPHILRQAISLNRKLIILDRVTAQPDKLSEVPGILLPLYTCCSHFRHVLPTISRFHVDAGDTNSVPPACLVFHQPNHLTNLLNFYLLTRFMNSEFEFHYTSFFWVQLSPSSLPVLNPQRLEQCLC